MLRLQSAKAAAEQTACVADTSTDLVARGARACTLGLHDGDAVEITDDLPAPPPPLAMTLEPAQQRRSPRVPSCAPRSERIAASKHIATLATRERTCPRSPRIGAYQHTTGLQPFQPANEEYIGMQAQWKVWDWGEHP